nr:fatty acid desaturase [Providencia burhodogranariea]
MDYNKNLRNKHKWLKYQNTIGLGVLLLFIAFFITSSTLFVYGYLSWWACLLLNTFFISIVHEIEHDLIHNLYFRNNKTIHNLMMLTVWLVRPSSANPWMRRKLHLDHHKTSGTPEDMEERIVANGTQWGLLRFFLSIDLTLSLIKLAFELRSSTNKGQLIKLGLKSFLPVTLLTWMLWYCFLIFNAIDLFFNLSGSPILWSEAQLAFIHYLNMATVILIGPNILWSFCLHFITSNIHYYGDIDGKNMIQQTQVFNSIWFLPLNLFSANFGSTHSIHHFVVNEPFYIRQMSARVAHNVMKENGVRFNDFGTFRRSNRWSKK